MLSLHHNPLAISRDMLHHHTQLHQYMYMLAVYYIHH